MNKLIDDTSYNIDLIYDIILDSKDLFIFTVQDSAVLAVYTWYMTIENYQDMRKDGITQVFVPLFKDTYKLPIYATLFTPYKNTVQCYFQSPSDSYEDPEILKKQSDSKKLDSHVYKFTDYVTSTKTNSGVYNVTCLVLPEDHMGSKISKALNITFISGQDSLEYCMLYACIQVVSWVRHSFSGEEGISGDYSKISM